jgi:hypothetical protein
MPVFSQARKIRKIDKCEIKEEREQAASVRGGARYDIMAVSIFYT